MLMVDRISVSDRWGTQTGSNPSPPENQGAPQYAIAYRDKLLELAKLVSKELEAIDNEDSRYVQFQLLHHSKQITARVDATLIPISFYVSLGSRMQGVGMATFFWNTSGSWCHPGREEAVDCAKCIIANLLGSESFAEVKILLSRGLARCNGYGDTFLECLATDVRMSLMSIGVTDSHLVGDLASDIVAIQNTPTLSRIQRLQKITDVFVPSDIDPFDRCDGEVPF